MLLKLTDTHLDITLESWEKLWAFKFDNFHLELRNITQVSTHKPSLKELEIRAPGTLIPYIIKAGTYYTQKTKKFWYVTQDSNYLVIDLQNELYNQIILTFKNGENELWYEKIKALLH
jgi:hypothetical protein